MPLANIIDRRTNHYNINIMAIYESSCHDNNAVGASQFPDCGPKRELTYFGIAKTKLSKAVKYAKRWNVPVTLYIYDIGSNNNYDIEEL